MPGVHAKTALITGAGSAGGIGFATARLLQAAGARVAITATSPRIHDRLAELAPGSFAMQADLTQPDQVMGLIAATEAALGPIDILVNNAGMVQTGREQPSTRFTETTDEGWAFGLGINLTTAYLATRAVLPGMMARRWGRVVHMSSVTGPVVGIAGSTIYATAKAGLLGMARALAIEAGPSGVTVNCIGPGWIETASSSQAEITAGRHTPIGRPGTPEEVGHVAVFLASEEASYITGQLIVVDGGNTVQEYKVSL